LNSEESALMDEINIDHESNSLLLGKYIATFLNDKKTTSNEDDKRVLFYRGQSDKMYSLTPSIFRKGLLSEEHNLMYDLLLSSPEEFDGIENTLERLIKMQHYGLPTRLLDVTMNPLVALFFACNKNADKDGEVIVFYEYMQRSSNIDVRCLVALAEYSGSTERQMLGFLTEKGLTNPDLRNLIKITHIPIEAPRNNERIRRQSGAFVVVGINGNEEGNLFQKIRFDLKPLLVRDFGDGISRSIIIPKESKSQLIKELDVLGINHAFLFPELEHQTMYLRKKYEEVQAL